MVMGAEGPLGRTYQKPSSSRAQPHLVRGFDIVVPQEITQGTGTPWSNRILTLAGPPIRVRLQRGSVRRAGAPPRPADE